MTARPSNPGRSARLLLTLALTLPIVSCDTSTAVFGAEVSGYVARVSVNGVRAQLVQAAPPAPRTGPSVTAPGSAEVITGGSWIADLVGSTGFQSVAVFVNGVDGYYLANLPSPATTAEVVVTFGGRPPDLNFDLGYQVAGTDGVWGPRTSTTITAIQWIGGDTQVSVTWNTPADVDLHVIEPSGEEIYFGNSASASGGELDIDANAACSVSAVTQENIGWLPGTAPSGEYIVRVEYWDACGAVETEYVVTISIPDAGQVLTFSGTFTGEGTGGGAGAGETITTFVF